MNMIKVERTWEVNGLSIVKSYEVDGWDERIPNTTIYSVETEDTFFEAFATLSEARKFAKSF